MSWCIIIRPAPCHPVSQDLKSSPSKHFVLKALTKMPLRDFEIYSQAICHHLYEREEGKRNRMPHRSSLHKPPGDGSSQASAAGKRQPVSAGGTPCMQTLPMPRSALPLKRKQESHVTCSFRAETRAECFTPGIGHVNWGSGNKFPTYVLLQFTKTGVEGGKAFKTFWILKHHF